MAVNIVNVTNINGTSDVGSVASEDSAEFAHNTSATHIFKLNNVIISNQADSAGVGGDALVNIEFRTTDSAHNFINDINIPIKSSLEVLAAPIYINNGERLGVIADSSALTVLVSYEDITDSA